jgi:hypothetical protein
MGQRENGKTKYWEIKKLAEQLDVLETRLKELSRYS